MIDYLYDGTFEGLLSCVYQHYYGERASGIYRRDQYQSNLFFKSRIVQTDEAKAVRVYEAIGRKISQDDLRRVYRVFLSSDPAKENMILHYLQAGFREGSKISSLHSNPVVYDMQRCEQKVSIEVHRMKGLIRFSVLSPGNILYCAIEPDHDILELIADHFSDRYRNEPFLIHDKKRSKGVFARNGAWYISDYRGEEMPGISEEESDYRMLWKKYFDTIAIRERINPACQKRFMPVRYWKNLTEFR